MRELPDEQNQALRGLWIRREPLIERLVREENRRAHVPQALQRSLVAQIDYLRQQLKDADKALDRAVRNSALSDKYELLTSVPGVGPLSGRRWRACALATVRRSICTCGFPACSFHEDT